MIKIEKWDVYGFEAAMRGMRNPMNSWEKGDTFINSPHNLYEVSIGPNDLELAKKLVKAGSDHRKFMRMIQVWVDITAPLYWWKEFDTYKVGTVSNSCSTMHKIQEKEFTVDDFSFEHLIDYESSGDIEVSWIGELESLLVSLNLARRLYLNTGHKKYWWQMIQLLPTSYNQKRTININYETLYTIYFARKDHKLDEWCELCDWILLKLPYMKEFIGKETWRNWILEGR